MLGSRTTPHKAPEDVVAVAVAASITPIDPSKETWQIIGNSPDAQLFDRFALAFPASEFASQAVAKAAQLRSTAAAAYTYNPSAYGYQAVYPPPAKTTGDSSRGETPAPVSQARYDAYGQPASSPAVSVGQPSAPSYSSPIYLIAIRDHGIRAASAYWVVEDTLHYLTMEHPEQQVPLNQVDRELTLKLNRERRVSIELPGK
jgi:hypothetical protein